MRLFKVLLLVCCLANFAACGGGGGGEGGSSGVDATVPSVSITAPANNATVSGSPTVTASASDNVGVARVEFYANNTLQSTDTAAPYSFDWNTLLVSDGPYTLKAVAYDAAGNSAPSANVTVTVGNDRSLAVVAITSPNSGDTVIGTVNVAATASDNTAVSRVEFFVNGASLGSDTTFPYAFSWNTSTLARGSYTLTARAYDTANNVQQSAGVVVTVPISATMNTVVTGNSAVGTVSIAGLPVVDVYGLNLTLTAPAGANVVSANASGPYAVSSVISQPPGPDFVLVNSNIGSGEAITFTFADVPDGATAASFGITLTAVFDGAGLPIQ